MPLREDSKVEPKQPFWLRVRTKVGRQQAKKKKVRPMTDSEEWLGGGARAGGAQRRRCEVRPVGLELEIGERI